MKPVRRRPSGGSRPRSLRRLAQGLRFTNHRLGDPRGDRFFLGCHALVDCLEHDGMLLEPCDERRSLIAVAPWKRRKMGGPLACRPVLVGADRHAAQSQRRQHLGNIASQRLVEDDNEHPIGPKATLVLECKVSEPVQPNRRLAAAGSSLNDDQARVRPGDELELTLVDEGSDFTKMFVLHGQHVVPNAELARARRRLGASGHALPATELGLRGVEPQPATLLAVREGALRRVDALQTSFGDGHAAPNQQVSADLAFTEHFVVLVPFVVAVV